MSLVRERGNHEKGGNYQMEHTKEVHPEALTGRTPAEYKFMLRAAECLQIMKSIKDISGESVFLDALMEECAELIQACSKYKRAQGWSDSPTPITRSQAYEMMQEEIRDVQMMIDAVRIMVLGEDPEAQLDNLQELLKWRRWRERLKEKGR